MRSIVGGMSEQEELSAKLRAAVASSIGSPGDISELRRLTGGATKATWSFKAKIGDAVLPLVMQLASPRQARAEGPLAELPRVTGADDAALMIAAGKLGVPAPPVRAVLAPEHGLGLGYVMDFVPGETIARRILREPDFAPLREGFAGQCGAMLGRLHAMEAAALPFLQPFGAAAQIDVYRRVYDLHDHPQPAIELAFRWAEDHLPRERRRTVVHGDFRMGNLICGPDRVRAVLDWELCHLGDPLEDLGWLCVKTWRFGGKGAVGGIGRREDLFAAYEQASGVAVDRDAVRFWEGFGCLKWAIMCMMKGQSYRRSGGERTVEAFAIGRRMEEPLYDFLLLLAGED